MEARAAAAAAAEKVFVALPEEARAGESTLAWALANLCAGGAATVVVTHVHVPPQMIPVMGVKFHASKLSPEQVSLFRQVERKNSDKQLDKYVDQCSKMKVRCEKLVFEKEDVALGLVELIALHGITKLVMAAAADRQYSRKMDRPKSKTAITVMQKADPSCKIWFVCKEQLICTRDEQCGIARSLTSFVPESDAAVVHFSSSHEQDDIALDFGFYDELQEACRAAENLMERALGESRKRQKADEQAVSSLQKAKETEDLYLKELHQKKEIEGALATANREREHLKQAIDLLQRRHDETVEKLREAIVQKLVLEQRVADMSDDLSTARCLIASGQSQYAQLQRDHRNAVRELEALHNERKLDGSSPSSVIPPPFASLCDDDDGTPALFVCPILQAEHDVVLVAVTCSFTSHCFFHIRCRRPCRTCWSRLGSREHVVASPDTSNQTLLLKSFHAGSRDANASPNAASGNAGGDEGSFDCSRCFTYEAEAIRDWLDSRHDTSLMTDLPLACDPRTSWEAALSTV